MRSIVNHADGSLDAEAWENIATKPLFGTHEHPEASASSCSRFEAEEEEINVHVDKLPTFAFFGDGGRRREDVVGGSDTSACRVRLDAKLMSFSSHPPSTYNLMPGAPQALQGSTNRGDNSSGLNDGDGVDSINSPMVDDMRDTNNYNKNTVNHNIVDVHTRDELLRIVRTRLVEQGPVVVMYHAPWCRKCSYLAPVFRQLAARNQVAPVDTRDGESGGGDDGAMLGKEVLFCRVDVSAWGGGAFNTRGSSGVEVRNDAAVKSRVAGTRTKRRSDGSVEDGVDGSEEDGDWLLHEGSSAVERCEVCGGSGFVSCGECEGKGAVGRSSPDGKHQMVVTCPACVGYKRLRCQACGGKCYMCD